MVAKPLQIRFCSAQGYPVGDAIPPFLRKIQADYLRTRHYSIGYSWGVGQDGSTWEIRGDDFNPASNPGRKHHDQTGDGVNFNDVSRSILIMTRWNEPATTAAVQAANEIIATHPDWDVVTHGTVDYTSCCGSGVTAQVLNGTIGAKPVPPPPPQGDVVTTTVDEWQQDRIGGDAGFVFQGDQIVQVTQAAGKKAVTVSVAVVTPNHDGYVVAFNGPQPPTATVDYVANQTTRGVTTVAVDGDGWFALHSSGYVKVIVDLIGVHS